MDGKKECVGVNPRRRCKITPLIADLVEQPVLLYGFQTTLKQLQHYYRCRYGSSFQPKAFHAMLNRVCSRSRLLLIAGGSLCTMLAKRLLCFNGECDVRDPVRLGRSVLSRRHFLDNSTPICGATLVENKNRVSSVAFHPTSPLLATGFYNFDKTVKLWRLSPDGSAATCVATLEGHS